MPSGYFLRIFPVDPCFSARCCKYGSAGRLRSSLIFIRRVGRHRDCAAFPALAPPTRHNTVSITSLSVAMAVLRRAAFAATVRFAALVGPRQRIAMRMLGAAETSPSAFAKPLKARLNLISFCKIYNHRAQNALSARRTVVSVI